MAGQSAACDLPGLRHFRVSKISGWSGKFGDLLVEFRAVCGKNEQRPERSTTTDMSFATKTLVVTLKTLKWIVPILTGRS